ncbi:MAG: flagellar hook-length control protein [Mucilaginibacter sp.]|nr:flagellar hook-length control protein [Mucilaginibacter sp.]
MSIAIAVQSSSSKTGSLLMAIVSTALIGVGTITLMQLFPDSLDKTCGIAGIGVLFAVFACFTLYKRCGSIALTITDSGQMRLSGLNQDYVGGEDRADIVQMMPDSTIWPFFILLRLRKQNKKLIVVPFFPGNLSPELFRRLSVACRWIATRNDAAQQCFPSNSDK